jgi:saccharopine dehydrogenase-like NADP-dependent oxidoreductase
VSRRFIVLGGASTIGRVVVRDLLASDRHNAVACGDLNAASARALVASLSSRRVTAASADIRKPRTLTRLFRGHDVVINCTQHTYNLDVMRAALAAGIHYVDLGGLFTWTRRQLSLDRDFQRAGLIAVPGMGCAPGITNVLARMAVDRLGRVEQLRIRVASYDRSLPPDAFVFAYSAQTIVEELTLRPWIFAGGRFRTVAPRSGWELARFPRPIGPRWIVRTRHSEIATLPVSLKQAGLRTCDFKVSFDRSFVRTLIRRLRRGERLEDLGTSGRRTRIAEDFEVARVVAITPRERGVRRILTVDCHAAARPAWAASAGDLDTAVPASIVAQMIASGEIQARGVIPPERAVPVSSFLTGLRRRGLRVTMRPGKVD